MFALDAKILNTIMNAVAPVTGEGVLFEVLEDGIIIRSMDAAGVEMIIVKMPFSVFTKYEMEKSEIVLDVTDMQTMTSSMNGMVEISISKSGRLSIISGKTKYDLALIDRRSVKIPKDLPALEFDNNIKIDVKELSSAIKSVKNVSNPDDQVDLLAIDNTLTVAFDNKYASVSTDISVAGEPMKEAIGKYSTSYIDSILSTLRQCTDVTLKFGTNYPIRFDAKYGDVYFIWLLAPHLPTGDE